MKNRTKYLKARAIWQKYCEDNIEDLAFSSKVQKREKEIYNKIITYSPQN